MDSTYPSIKVKFSKTVEAARIEGRPLTALESVIVAHGLPRPRNLEVARQCEDVVRREGAVPATLAIRDGILRTGLEPDELETLASTEGIVKVNLGNLGVVLARGGWGATTVASSLWGCARPGVEIPVLVTGGIGGVHRGFSETFDISSDLVALSRYRVMVVCSGVKSLLDVGATREHLETLGVPVLGWKTDSFPRFYIRESQWSVDARVETPEEAARIAMNHWSAGGAGLLLTVPVPESDALSEEDLEEALSVAEFERQQAQPPIAGREVTPFLLSRLVHHTRGRSLAANTALILNNCSVGARTARALHLMR